jgi:hypothetical protein
MGVNVMCGIVGTLRESGQKMFVFPTLNYKGLPDMQFLAEFSCFNVQQPVCCASYVRKIVLRNYETNPIYRLATFLLLSVVVVLLVLLLLILFHGVHKIRL